MKKKKQTIDLGGFFYNSHPWVHGLRVSHLPNMSNKVGQFVHCRHLTLVAEKSTTGANSNDVYLVFDFSYYDTGGTRINRVAKVDLCSLNLASLPNVTINLVRLNEKVSGDDAFYYVTSHVILRCSKDWRFENKDGGLLISKTIFGRRRECFVRDVL